MAKLIVREGPGRGTAYELVDDVTKIGRDPGNAVQIPSETISRTHAEIVRRGEGDAETWSVRDLQSKNGVLVNGARVENAVLSSGDEIRLGDAVLNFIEREFDTLEITDADGASELAVPGPTAVQRPAGARQTLAVGAHPQKRLLALLELAQVAGSAKSYPELFGAVVSAIERDLQPHRTVPILFDEQKGLLRPWVSQRGEFDKHLSKMPISSTIVNYVREHRVAILIEAAAKDARLRDAQSIAAHRITSAMCAPIQIGDRLLGELYVDRFGDAARFTNADLELLVAIAAQSAVAIENVRVREEIGRERYVREREARGAYDIVGQCQAMESVFRFIAKAAPADAGVLIEGESGTGKELVARAIHLNSPRRHQPFEAVNCAAMAPTLLESELFGHVRGAFTGADRDRPGRFELADGGTLFLDEIGELPDGSQSKLLRVIETGELRRVGDIKDRKVNARVIAATNKKLAEEVARARFREDLYFRLNVLKISLPTLRERPGDMRVLAEYFLKQFAEKCGRPALRFEADVWPVFEGYPWPGNVRELRNAIERMVVMAEGDALKLEDVPFEIRSGKGAARPAEAAAPAAPPDDSATLRDLERAHIARVMQRTAGNKKEAARILGIDRSTLYAKLKAYGLESEKDEDGKTEG
ncbi:MAG: sigma 54-interacting transcriptional regulator [Candidatus Brocadiia bacterium]|jgi:Nif-specific regulatory protein